jgi:hypothetical protein
MFCIDPNRGYIRIMTSSSTPTAPHRRVALINTYSTYNLGDEQLT